MPDAGSAATGSKSATLKLDAKSLLNVANHVTLYASSDDQALIASKQVHGYPRAGESGEHVVVVPGVETIDVSGIDLSLLGHSYYGDNESMLRDLYEVVRARLPAAQRALLVTRRQGALVYWQLAQRPGLTGPSSMRRDLTAAERLPQTRFEGRD